MRINLSFTPQLDDIPAEKREVAVQAIKKRLTEAKWSHGPRAVRAEAFVMGPAGQRTIDVQIDIPDARFEIRVDNDSELRLM